MIEDVYHDDGTQTILYAAMQGIAECVQNQRPEWYILIGQDKAGPAIFIGLTPEDRADISIVNVFDGELFVYAGSLHKGPHHTDPNNYGYLVNIAEPEAVESIVSKTIEYGKLIKQWPSYTNDSQTAWPTISDPAAPTYSPPPPSATAAYD